MKKLKSGATTPKTDTHIIAEKPLYDKVKLMICDHMLKRDTYNLRKADKNVGWKLYQPKNFIKLVNRFSVSTAIFRKRTQNTLHTPPQLIMIDVDHKDNNVESQLQKYGLHYYKVPSGSNDGWHIDYKWHYFVKLSSPLSKEPSIARGQLKAFYEELALDGYDNKVEIDTARYFAPCGAAEVKDTPAWDARVKLCDEMSEEVLGNAYVPRDDVAPIFSGTGTPVDIDVAEIAFRPQPEWEPELTLSKERVDGHKSWIVQLDTPISLGQHRWTTAGHIASKLDDGETVSNLIGCPAFNHDHKDPSTVGYGYVTRKGDMVFFNCGGNSCHRQTYKLFAPFKEGITDEQ